ncbi:MAG: heavy metal translocating P-type ATPase, partial [Oscillospiraceae bacterium]|nr:heavy metal translocating P-type ATPase [Oscillospiraceae bacterium]
MEAAIRKEIRLDGLCCANCAAKIERAAGSLPGVKSASVDVMAQKLTLDADGDSNFPDLLAEITRIAARVEPEITVSLAPRGAAERGHEHEHAHEHGEHGSPIRKILMGVGTALFVAGMALELNARAKLAVFLAAYLLIGGDVVLRALKNISKGRVFDENFLMSVATIGAFAIGEYPEGAAVMLFYQVGEAFQQYAVGKSRRSITALMDIRPDFANLKVGDEIRRVSPE